MQGSDRLLRLTDVVALTGVSRSSIYNMIAEKRFPPAVRLGHRTVRWSETAVRKWIQSLPIAETRCPRNR
jgi:prophage regulatory protein